MAIDSIGLVNQMMQHWNRVNINFELFLGQSNDFENTLGILDDNTPIEWRKQKLDSLSQKVNYSNYH